MSTQAFRMILENVTGALVSTTALAAIANAPDANYADALAGFWNARQFVYNYSVNATGVSLSGTVTWPFNSGDGHSSNYDPWQRWQAVTYPMQPYTGIYATNTPDTDASGNVYVNYATDGYNNWALLPYCDMVNLPDAYPVIVASRIPAASLWPAAGTWAQVGVATLMGVTMPVWFNEYYGTLTTYALSLDDTGGSAYWQESDYTPLPLP